MLHLHLNGFAFQYLWPNSSWWVQRNGFFWIFCTCFFAVLYSRSFLETKRQAAVFDKILSVTVVVPGIPLSVLVVLAGTNRYLKETVLLWSAYTASILFVLVVRRVYLGSRQARFMLIGLSAFLLEGALYSLQTAGVLPTNALTVSIIQLGSAVMVLFFSLGLADKINTMKRELEVSETKILHQNKELDLTNRELKASNETLIEFHEKLKKKEEQFRSIIEHLPLPVVMSRKGPIEYLNRSPDRRTLPLRNHRRRPDHAVRNTRTISGQNPQRLPGCSQSSNTKDETGACPDQSH
ncbi:MAG: hypothetical protein GY866_38055 [Proteobacteria bacterium]|nr:hypothetical protein [Pseudomonadota bacterium]